MTSGRRLAILAAAIVVLVGAFFVLQPGDDDEPTTADTAPSATTLLPPPGETTGTGGTPPTTSTPAPGRTTTTPAPGPEAVVVRVREGRPVGGVEEIRVSSGDRVRFAVSSPDTSGEVHVHGYDLRRDLEAGGRVTFSFDANAEGVFEVELEGSHTKIAEIEVQPN